jgi:hypothetical protein
MLKELRDFGTESYLVAHSGIQLIDFGFKYDEKRGGALTFAELPCPVQDGTTNLEPIKLVRLAIDRESGGYVDYQTSESIRSEAVYSVRLAQSLTLFDGAWLPIPYLKWRGTDGGKQTFERGPTNWARLRVKQLEKPDVQGNTHRVTMGFDTMVDRPGRRYVVVTDEDVKGEASFQFAPDWGPESWFLAQDWVVGWLKGVLAAAMPRLQVSLPRRNDDQQVQCFHWVTYIVLIEQLKTLIRPPRIKFLDTLSDTSPYTSIDAELILDIGNSRTCGVLIEASKGGRFDLRDSSRLELRDLTEPTNVYNRPFASHTEFVEPDFGNIAWSRRAGQSTFVWPSPVRVGPEAVRLNGRGSGSDGSTGLAAPKRYVWDDREITQQWYFNNSAKPESRSSPVVGPIMKHLTVSGDVRTEIAKGTQIAVLPKFARASLFTFTVMELVYQALTQLNSVDLRARRAEPKAPRRLRRIILTIPTATPLVERERFDRRAKAAISLLWDIMEWKDYAGAPSRPEVRIAYDEATCTQIVYLYDQVVHRFRQAPRDYLASAVPPAGALVSERRKPLRIASLDIGGGTTDLMILSFEVERGGTAFLPEQEFREGFRRAGDEILKAVVVEHVVPAIERVLRERGIRDTRDFMVRLLSDADKDAPLRNQRRLFVTQILVPIALGLLGQYETATAGESDRADFPFEWFFDESPSAKLVDFIESAARTERSDFHLRDVGFPVDFNLLARTVTNVIGGIIENLCRVVQAFGCDFFLVTGRPSRLPIVRDLILRSMATDPHRVVFMHDYNVANWYPFAGPRGTVEDPKTTVVVGALVASLAEERRIDDFSLGSGPSTQGSTVNFVGRMPPEDMLPARDVVLSRKNGVLPRESAPIVFGEPGFIGFRQLPDEDWPATPLYRLGWRNDEKPTDRQIATLPWRVVMQLREDSNRAGEEENQSEHLEIERIEDRDGNSVPPRALELRLQTMRQSDGHWLDTGLLDLI